MKRKTLDILFSIGGLVARRPAARRRARPHRNANFANNYVADQLSQQNITFKTADTLTAEEKKAGLPGGHTPGSS